MVDPCCRGISEGWLLPRFSLEVPTLLSFLRLRKSNSTGKPYTGGGGCRRKGDGSRSPGRCTKMDIRNEEEIFPRFFLFLVTSTQFSSVALSAPEHSVPVSKSKMKFTSVLVPSRYVSVGNYLRRSAVSETVDSFHVRERKTSRGPRIVSRFPCHLHSDCEHRKRLLPVTSPILLYFYKTRRSLAWWLFDDAGGDKYLYDSGTSPLTEQVPVGLFTIVSVPIIGPKTTNVEESIFIHWTERRGYRS